MGSTGSDHSLDSLGIVVTSNCAYHHVNGNVWDKNDKMDETVELKTPVLQVETKGKDHRNYPQCNFISSVKTLATYVAFFGSGMGTSILGATILQLEQQTNSSTEQIASLFTWRALGSMVGNLFVGILFERVPPELILLFGCLVMSAVQLAIPFCTSLVGLMTVMVVNGVLNGVLGGGCNSYVIKIWRLKAPPFLQALHFIISFGSSISPLIVDIFVSDNSGDVNVTLDNHTHNILSETESNGMLGIMYNKSTPIYEADYLDVNSSNVFHFTDSYASELLYPFMITSVSFILAAVVYSWTICIDVINNRKKSLTRVDSFLRQQKEKTEPIKNKAIFVTLLIYLLIYGGLECTYGAWILAFCVKHLNINFETAALISTAFWASLAGGRAISIITTKLFSTVSITCLCLSMSTVALAVETYACEIHPAVMWVCSIAVGMSFAPLFGNCISFSQKELNTSGRATTVFVLFLYLGFMGMPALVGYLFATYTPMYFLYILTAGSTTITLMFFGVVIYNNHIKARKGAGHLLLAHL